MSISEKRGVSGVKPNTWAPRCNPGLVSSPAWSGQGIFRASPCPARKDSSSRAPSLSTLTPQPETCEPWRQQALSCHVFDGPHAAAPQHGACHTAFRSILAHIIMIKLKPLALLHQLLCCWAEGMCGLPFWRSADVQPRVLAWDRWADRVRSVGRPAWVPARFCMGKSASHSLPA
jgi:hypothetical protein